jgi:hypothetical protein
MQKLRTIIILLIITVLSSCNDAPQSVTPPDKQTEQPKPTNPENWEVQKQFIEKNFAKYTSCDSIYIDYNNNKISFIKNNHIHTFTITNLQPAEALGFLSHLAYGSNYHNIYQYGSDIISREVFSHENYSFYSENDDNPTIQNYVNWENSNRSSTYSWERKINKENPYKKDLDKLLKKRYDDFISNNRKKYNQYTIIDYSHSNTSLSPEVKSGKKTDNYIQFSFKTTLIKFEIYDNVVYDEKYDDQSLSIVEKCLSDLEKLTNSRLEQLTKEIVKAEQSRIDSLKKLKRIN